MSMCSTLLVWRAQVTLVAAEQSWGTYAYVLKKMVRALSMCNAALHLDVEYEHDAAYAAQLPMRIPYFTMPAL